MKVAISNDEYFPIIEDLIKEIDARDFESFYFGPRKGEKSQDWTFVTEQCIETIQRKEADEGIILCWTGTGCSILANKFPGIRAALCVDGETAKGARIYNHANVLALSLRLLTSKSLDEILDAWFATPFSTDSWNLSQVKQIQTIEEKYGC